MRRAEIVTAVLIGLFSIYLMWKSTELPIGWIPEKGPAGGAFPFWLSAAMFLCSIWILLCTEARPAHTVSCAGRVANHEVSRHRRAPCAA